MVHIQNVPHVLQNGITHRNSVNANNDFITIGDQSLIHTRRTKEVKVDNGDFSNLNAPTIVLGNFIPFYFGVRMPMLYVMQNGGNFVDKATPPQDIVYLACSLNNILESDNVYYFSDGHGTDCYSTFYDSSKIEELPAILDWEAIKAPYWSGNENLTVKRKKQAEFLVSSDINTNLIVGFGCYNQNAKNKLIAMGIAEEKIKIIPQAYY